MPGESAPTERSQYEIIRPIASGGMGTVYLGKLSGLAGFERRVAIKRMHPHLAQHPTLVDMFINEARIAAQIHHPNVVSTLDVYRAQGELWLIMDYVDGSALAPLMSLLAKSGRSFPLPELLRIMSDALYGLHEAHELKDPKGESYDLIHRDVSPQNILVGRDGISRLTDFGVARATVRATVSRKGSIKGKLAYASPERFLSGELNRTTDIYAAGVVFWEMLSLRNLFTGANDAEIIRKVLEHHIEDPRCHRPDIPPLIAEICLQAMSHEPRYRFQSAAEFADAIWDAAESSGIKLAQPKQVRQLLESLPELFILPNHEAALADALITTAPAANDPLKKPAKKKLTIHSGANSVPIANDFETELTEKRPSAFFTDAEKFEFLDEISEGHSFHIDPFASFIQAEAAEKQTRESRPGEDDTLIIVAQQNLNHEELSKALELSLARIHLADLAQLNDQLRVARVPSLRPNAVAITALSPKQLLELGNKASPSSEFSIQEASVHAPPINFSPQSATKPSILSPDELSPRSSQPSIEICPTVDLVVPDLTATEFNPNDITEPSFNSNSEPMLSRFLPTSLLAIATLALALFAIWIWN